MSLGAFLSAAAGPLVKRALGALGIGVVSYVGVEVAVDTMLGAARSAWQGMPADIAAYMAYCGANQALGIIAGAIVARVALSSLKRLALL
jgi:hypothetical protein